MGLSRYHVKHASLTDIGLKRNLNEDSIGFIEINDGYVFVVCDGMGGHEGGEIASKAAVRFIFESLNAQTIENPAIALHQAVTFANHQIYLTAQNRPDLKGMGTTVAILLFYKDEIYTAHVGDSRIYVLTDNRFFPVTKDHSVVQDMVDKGILQASEAENHPRKNEITRALGIKEDVTPAISNKALKAKTGDRFILCSDGLSGLIRTDTFYQAAAAYKIPDVCTRELVALAKKGGGHDNISVQVVDIIQSPFTESFYPSQPPGLAVPPKKKMKRSMVISLLLGGMLLLGGIGWGGGILIDKWVNSSTKIVELPKPKEDSLTNSTDSLNLINTGYIQKTQAIDSVKKYLNNKHDTYGYVQKLGSSTPEDISFLKEKKVLANYNENYKLYKLSVKVLEKLNLKVSPPEKKNEPEKTVSQKPTPPKADFKDNNSDKSKKQSVKSDSTKPVPKVVKPAEAIPEKVAPKGDKPQDVKSGKNVQAPGSSKPNEVKGKKDTIPPKKENPKGKPK